MRQKEIDDIIKDLCDHVHDCQNECTQAEYYGKTFPYDVERDGKRSAKALMLIEWLISRKNI